MKKMNLMKVAVAVALLFAVNMEADAQFGNLLNKAKKAVKEKAEKVVDGSSTSSITSPSSVKDVVTSVASPVDKPWTMSYEGQSKVSQYLEHMENVSSEEVAMLRDQMIKRYLYNEAAHPTGGDQENQLFAGFVNQIWNNMGILNPYKVKIVNLTGSYKLMGVSVNSRFNS